MRMPTLAKPRAGWTKQLGRFLLHANWAKCWDGWGREIKGTAAIEYDTLAIKPFIAPYGIGLIVVLWRLRMQIAYSMTVADTPADGGEG